MKIDDWIIRGLLGLLALAIIALFATSSEAVEPPEDHGMCATVHIDVDIERTVSVLTEKHIEGEIWTAYYKNGNYATLMLAMKDGEPAGVMFFTIYGADGCELKFWRLSPSDYEEIINIFLQSDNVADYTIRKIGPGA